MGLARTDLGDEAVIDPDHEFGAFLLLQAPEVTEPTTINCQFGMFKEGYGVFGESTENVQVLVVPDDGAEFVSLTPSFSTLLTGESVEVLIRFKNVGMNTWSRAGGYALGFQNPEDSTTWYPFRIEMPTGLEITRGETWEVSVTLTAPLAAGVHDLQFQMLRETEVDTETGTACDRCVF